VSPSQKREVIREAASGFGARRLIGMGFAVHKKRGRGRWWVEVIDIDCISAPRYAKVKGGLSSGKPWWVPLAELEVK